MRKYSTQPAVGQLTYIKRSPLPWLAFLVIIFVLPPHEALARAPIAFVADTHGDVRIVREGTSEALAAHGGALLFGGDHIRTGPASWAEVEYYDDVAIRIEATSYLMIQEKPLSDDGTEVESSILLTLGEIWVHVTRRLDRLIHFSVETPSAVAGVRGTIFQVTVDQAGATGVNVLQGAVDVSCVEGVVRLASGDAAWIDSTEIFGYRWAGEPTYDALMHAARQAEPMVRVEEAEEVATVVNEVVTLPDEAFVPIADAAEDDVESGTPDAPVGPGITFAGGSNNELAAPAKQSFSELEPIGSKATRKNTERWLAQRISVKGKQEPDDSPASSEDSPEAN